MSTNAASVASPGRLGRLGADGLLLLIDLYRVTLAPLIGGFCRYEPSCSRYAEEAIRRHGALRGSRPRPASADALSSPAGRGLRPGAVSEHDQKGNMEERRLLVALALVHPRDDRLEPLLWSEGPGAPPRRRPRVAGRGDPGARSRGDAHAGPSSSQEKQAARGRPCAPWPPNRRAVWKRSRPWPPWPSRTGARASCPGSSPRYPDARGRGEEMVRPGRNGVRPLDLETGDRDVDAQLREALFRPSAETVTVAAGGEGELSFTWAAGGLEAEKRLRFLRGGELVEVSASVKRDGRSLPVKLLFGPGLGTASKEEKGVTGYVAPAGNRPGPLRGGAPARGQAHGSATLRRRAVDRHREPLLRRAVRARRARQRRDAGRRACPRRTTRPRPRRSSRWTWSAPALLFVGAKDYHALRGLGHSLEEVVDVGSWIGPIVKPLLSILPRVYGVLGNYGWSILALTVVINLLMAPLRHYGIANSLRMAKVAPEVRAIQERYRKVPLLERQAMNDEVAKVYERHGMNMGTQMTVGCLPMLLTMPFLFAIYRVLQVSIELKGAPFLWIPDLSHQDPLLPHPRAHGRCPCCSCRG